MAKPSEYVKSQQVVKKPKPGPLTIKGGELTINPPVVKVTPKLQDGILVKRHPDNQNNAGSRGNKNTFRQTGTAKPIR